ncbi:hypothetical protein [Rhizobium laguerreae]|uniref:hypothetical protein n=1 Tax=Rhizobium laguerreae TaxID=1076926 RepID=UPI001C902D68|nr:hypothetical protein [Rhizobium laguerreae]MBY3389196.1 hypothetical protein [Rhizobium laguerreae]MBY3402947.1 hypothetical protein [Rhizobium laguerreae]MBY3409886.1 hypothetical protein [Rhizobium laguerreae]
MAKIQSDDIGSDDGQMLVYGLFIDGDELIGHGDGGLADVLALIDEDSHMQVKAIYHDVKASGLGNFHVSFDVDETGETSWASDLKVVLDGHAFELGGYRDFAEHNGMLGLRHSCRTHRLWDENEDGEVA